MTSHGCKRSTTHFLTVTHFAPFTMRLDILTKQERKLSAFLLLYLKRNNVKETTCYFSPPFPWMQTLILSQLWRGHQMDSCYLVVMIKSSADGVRMVKAKGKSRSPFLLQASHGFLQPASR